MFDRPFAPDVVGIDGRFYLCYGVGLSATGIGVAVSDSPTGPFEYLGRVRYPEGAKRTWQKHGADGSRTGISPSGPAARRCTAWASGSAGIAKTPRSCTTATGCSSTSGC